LLAAFKKVPCMNASLSSLGSADASQMRNAHAQAGRLKLLGQLSAQQPSTGSNGINADAADKSEVREKFDAFVGESFYSQMLKEMHKTVGKTPYFSGGRAEEAFQGQLDQVLSEKMAKANGNQFSGAMYDLFNLQMQGGRK
jgi:Rod binding protein